MQLGLKFKILNWIRIESNSNLRFQNEMKIGANLKNLLTTMVFKKTMKRHKANFFIIKKHLNLFIFISESSKQIPLWKWHSKWQLMKSKVALPKPTSTNDCH